MGGGDVTKSFMDADLVDIWSVAFVPTLLGAGIPMFPSSTFRELRLKLVRTHTYPSGVIERDTSATSAVVRGVDASSDRRRRSRDRTHELATTSVVMIFARRGATRDLDDRKQDSTEQAADTANPEAIRRNQSGGRKPTAGPRDEGTQTIRDT